MVGDVLSYVKEKGFNYKTSGNELRLKYCPFCEDDKTGDYTHFYFDTKDSLYFCHKCQSRGNLYKFKIEMGDIEPIRKAKEFNYVKPESISLETNFYDEYFKKRNISQVTLEKYKVGKTKHNILGNSVVFSYYTEKNILFNYKYRNSKKEQRIEKGAEINYYGLQYVDFNKNYLFVTEGEDDCHCMVDYGFENVVSLPMGAKNYSPSMGLINKRFNQIYLIFDMDEPGQIGAKKFSEKAGLYKCENVELPYKDVRECSIRKITKENILECISKSKKFKHESIIKAGDIKEDFVNFLENDKEYKGLKLNKGKMLTNILGGIRTEEMTVLTGQTGSGKSTYAYNLAMWVEEVGMPAMIMSFELKMLRLMSKLLMIHSGEPLVDTSRDYKSGLIDQLNYRNIYFLNEQGYFSLEKIGTIIEYAKKYYGISFFVIDHLHYFLKIKNDERKEIDTAIRQIKAWCNEFDVHVVVVVHPSATKSDEEITINSLKGASSIKQECDNFMIVRRIINSKGEYSSDCSEISSNVKINKNRAFGDTGTIDYRVKMNNNSFVEG